MWSLTRGLTDFEARILRCLASSGPLNVNQTRRKLRSAYSSTRKAIFNLVGKGILVESGFMTVKRTKLETQTYDLSLRGVFLVLREELKSGDIERFNISFIRRIIGKYDSLLPLIFGKWDYFDKMGTQEMALVRLKMVVDSLKEEHRWWEQQRVNTEKLIYLNFFLLGFLPYRWEWEGSGIMANPEAWHNVWKQDEEIKKWILRNLKENLKELESAIVYVRKTLSSIEG